jgi:hypothetical protein
MLRLIALGFCLFLAGAQDPADKVKALIEKLESDELETRAAAQKELANIGRTALPMLEKELATAMGEQKQRLQSVIEHIRAFGTPPLVTLETKDRPLREIAADLERQTGIPVRIVGAISEVKLSVSAKGAYIWKVVEDLCRTRGDLMYRFARDTIEIYPSRFRTLPCVDQAGMRFFIDRFIWESGNLIPGSIRVHGGLLVPPGSRVLWMQLAVEELTDDTGKNVAELPQGGGYFLPTGDRYLPHGRRFLFPAAFHPAIQGAPSLEAVKIARFRGTVEVRLASVERVLAAIRDPLGRPSTPSGDAAPCLGIDRWDRNGGQLRIHLTYGWKKEDTEALDSKGGLNLCLRLKDGHWVTPQYWNSGPTDRGVDRKAMIADFRIPPDAVPTSLELVVPESFVEYQIPFEFKDIPLR